MSSSSCLEVHLKVLRNNIRFLRKMTLQEPYFVVKSQAYGMGGLSVVQTLVEEKCFKIGVLNISEALCYKHFFSKKFEVLLLSPFDEKEAPLILKYPQVEPVVGSLSQLEILFIQKQKQKWWEKTKPHWVHVKFDVGLCRFGFEKKDITDVLSFFKKQDVLKLKGICGHLPYGAQNSQTQQQVLYFEKIVQEFRESFPNIQTHLLSSSSLTHFYVHGREQKWGSRIGGSLYGIKHKVEFQSEESKKIWDSVDLQFIASLKTKIIFIRRVLAGQKVSYEGEWQAPRSSVIGVVSVGYEDGLVQYKNHFVLFRGKRVPVVGKICMNFLMVDITDFENPQEGEEVVIFGEQKGGRIPIEEWSLPGESPYAMMTRIGKPISRIYK